LVEDVHSHAVQGCIDEPRRFYFRNGTTTKSWIISEEGYLWKDKWTTSLMYSGKRFCVMSMADGSVSRASVSHE